MKSRRIIAIVFGGIVMISAAILLMSESRAFQITGILLLIVLVLFTVVMDWVEAWLNERHVENHPQLLKNDAIGEAVTVRGNFCLSGGVATGLVTLGGEKWKACCSPEYLPQDGEVLQVKAREGLTLFVQPMSSDR